MSFARSMFSFLVEKHLWPIALLLVVALVAIPVIGSGGHDTGGGVVAGAPTVAPAVLASDKPAVALLGPASVRSRPGRVVDPFRRPPAAKVRSATSASAPSAASGGATTPASGGAGSSSSTAGAGTSPSSSATTKPAVKSSPAVPKPLLDVYRTTVRWSSNAAPKARLISRLTPLGGDITPALLYVGVARDGRHALFLLGPDATANGRAGCPNVACRIVSLARGDSQSFDLQSAGAAPQQFELKLVSIKRDQLAGAALAARARAHVHGAGRAALRALIKDPATAKIIGAYAYDVRGGVMVAAADGRPLAAP